MPVPDVSSLFRTLAQKADPAHSALLVIDVQNDFVADGGFFDKVGGDVRTIQQQRVPNLLRLIDAARQAGVLVIFVQAIYDPGDLSDAMRERNLRLNSELPRCLSGSWGAEFYRVEPLPGEPVIVKHRYSAMVGTDLLALLKERGIRSLLLSGVATDTCVEFRRARCLFQGLLRDAGRGLLRRCERGRPSVGAQAFSPGLRADRHVGRRDGGVARAASNRRRKPG